MISWLSPSTILCLYPNKDVKRIPLWIATTFAKITDIGPNPYATTCTKLLWLSWITSPTALCPFITEPSKFSTTNNKPVRRRITWYIGICFAYVIVTRKNSRRVVHTLPLRVVRLNHWVVVDSSYEKKLSTSCTVDPMGRTFELLNHWVICFYDNIRRSTQGIEHSTSNVLLASLKYGLPMSSSNVPALFHRRISYRSIQDYSLNREIIFTFYFWMFVIKVSVFLK